MMLFLFNVQLKNKYDYDDDTLYARYVICSITIRRELTNKSDQQTVYNVVLQLQTPNYTDMWPICYAA